MFRLICRKLMYFKPRRSLFSHGNSFTTSYHKPPITEPQSLTLSYLQKSCGFSLESAISASRKLRFESTQTPDSVLELLRTHGLSQTHIENLIKKRPLLLLADLDGTLKPNLELFESLGFTGNGLAKLLAREPRVIECDANTFVEFFRANGFSDKQITAVTMKLPRLYCYNAQKMFKPKFEFLKSLGLSELEIVTIISAEPYVLQRSLEDHIVPCIQFLNHFLGNNKDVLKAIRAGSRVLLSNRQKVIQPNISVLANHGVPNFLIMKMMVTQPKSLLLSTDRLSEIVCEVKKLGFEPINCLFGLAIRSMAVMSKARWEEKLEAYMSFGLTKDEIYSAFKLQPMCMIVSVEKIRQLMGFFLHELRMEPLVIFKNPGLLMFSLEKRILPRCSVLDLLMSKELIKRNVSLVTTLKMTEKEFVEKLVKKYQHKVPEVVGAYQGKIKFQGFPFDMKM